MSINNLLVLRIFTLVATGLGLFIASVIISSTPTVPGKRLGLRGVKRLHALEKVPFWASLEPLVRWLGARFSGLIPESMRESLNKRLSLAGDYMGLLPEEVVGLTVVTGVGGGVLGYMMGILSELGNMITFAALFICAAQPYMNISSTAADRMKHVSRRLPYAIDLLALAVGAGLDFPGSVRQVVEKSGSPTDPVVEEFTLILQNLQLGRTRREALEVFAERVPTEIVIEFVGSVVQAELRGNPIVDVLRIQAEVARRKRSVRAEESAAKAGVKMLGPLVLVFIAILLLVVAPIVMNAKSAGM